MIYPNDHMIHPNDHMITQWSHDLPQQSHDLSQHHMIYPSNHMTTPMITWSTPMITWSTPMITWTTSMITWSTPTITWSTPMITWTTSMITWSTPNDHMIYPQWSHDLNYIVWIPDPFDQARKGLGCNLAPNCWNDAISVVEERTPLWLIEHTVDSWWRTWPIGGRLACTIENLCPLHLSKDNLQPFPSSPSQRFKLCTLQCPGTLNSTYRG